jgi:hypothetical protein
MRSSKKWNLVAVFGAAVLAVASHASANILWSWSISSSGINGSGTFETTGSAAVANTPYLILPTPLTGSINGSPITALSGYLGADNLFAWDGTPTSALRVNNNGVSFDTAAGKSFNFYQFTNASLLLPATNLQDTDGSRISTGVTSSVQPIGIVPEPTAVAAVAAGAVMVTSRRRRRVA